MDVPMLPTDSTSDDFCAKILAHYANSPHPSDQHLCTILGSISHKLHDQQLPTNSLAVFGAASSSLHSLLLSEPNPAPHAVESLITILSLVIPKTPNAVVKKKKEYLEDVVVRVLRLKDVTVGGIVGGLKCVRELLVVRDGVCWNDMGVMYGVALGFVTHSNSKVRKQSTVCLHNVLESLRGKSALGPASEGISNIFEKYLLLAGGSSSNGSDGPKGAQEVLYVLDALKDCLPLMSLKYSSNVLKYFKSLLELCQPVVTKRITSCLNFLLVHPTSEVSPDALVNLLCSLALNISTNETSVDAMTITARLLDVGMKKVYAANRQLCVNKLPVVFNALADILASEHEESIYAAMDAFKGLINSCIDENLIKEGIDQIVASSNMVTRFGPTIVEKVCATIESLLDYRYSVVWDMVFQVIAAMFDKLDIDSSYLLGKTLKGLGDLQKLPDENFPYRKQLHECIGSALGAMGPETFLSILPLRFDADDISHANVWLLEILKDYTVGARLQFFRESILPIIGDMKRKSRKFELKGLNLSSNITNGLFIRLWGLLPSFCQYPTDTVVSFKQLVNDLLNAFREEPGIRTIICSSLVVLICQNKSALERQGPFDTEASVSRQRAMSRYTPQVAIDNLGVLRAAARDLLSVLSSVLLMSGNDIDLQEAIGHIASISDKEVVSKIFKSTMQKLLKVTQVASKEENSKTSSSMQIDDTSNEITPTLMRARLLDLAASLLPGLNGKEIDLLFVAIRPALEDDKSLIQKKAYNALASILKNSEEFLSSKLEELLSLMVEVLPSCHFSAKHFRLDCLYLLIVHVSKGNSEQRWLDFMSSFLTEIILSLKEANKKTRNRAYDMLVRIGHACGDEELGGKRENLNRFFNMVAGGLTGETPHMVSAAVKCLARLTYEFSDLIATAYNVLPSTYLLLQRKNREIIKASLGFLKVLVAKSQAEWLGMHLRSMVEGLLKWQDDRKSHFKAKVKLLLELLVKKCGFEAVKAVMPEEHMKLLTNIWKINERKEKKRPANSGENKSQLSGGTMSRLSKWNHSRIFSDFGDEDTEGSESEYMGVKTISGRRSKVSKATSLRSKRTRTANSLPDDLLDQLEDEPLDLLDQYRTRSALRSSELKRKADSDDELEVDSEGRLIIHIGEKPKKRTPADSELDSRSEAGSYMPAKSMKKTDKRRKTSDSGWAYTGTDYASKRAGGDVKKKGKLEPYAYWPLDRKMMSRRSEHRASARKGMASVVKQTKKLEGKSASGFLATRASSIKKVQKKHRKKNN